MPYVYPGIGLGQELQLLRTAGLSPLEVLRTATINPARYLSLADRYGSVTVGKYADLILLDANPLEDLANMATLRTVFKKGRPMGD
jgi:imidazolonepropionase-like amidohydrolase